MKVINEEMRKVRIDKIKSCINFFALQKKEGLTLGEKIEEELNEVKKKNLVSHIDDAFYKEEHERGCQFFVRRTDLMKEKRTLHIIDEIEERIK